MARKLRIGLLYGGRSAEHEISIISARSIYRNLDRKKYKVTLIGIGQDGRWYLEEGAGALLASGGVELKRLRPSGPEISVEPALKGRFLRSGVGAHGRAPGLDVVFPILHGPYGEDGTVQGLLELTGIPYVGADVLGSAVGMDKEVAKRLLRDAGLAVADFEVLTVEDKATAWKLARRLGFPVFVKPSRMGSSVGVSRVAIAAKLSAALQEAFKYDHKVLLEKAVQGREIECAVLGGDKPRASVAGEVIPKKGGFYSYEAKYIDESGAQLAAPAKLSAAELKRVQDTAIKVFQALNCHGMARVDMFLTPQGKLLVNELNTIPGFTTISMYPKLWELSGVPLPKLLDELIRLALIRHKRRGELRTKK